MTRDDYLRGVGSALRDLPWRQRRELLAELRGHLADFPADTDLEERLGTPEQYAADLRAAEGISRRRGPTAYIQARRPRNVILVVVALIIAGLVAAGIAWVQSYAPLDYAGGAILPSNGVLNANGIADTVTFEKGGHFRLGIPISNNGSFGVQIEGLGALRASENALLPHPPLPFSYRLLMTRPSKNWDDRGKPLIPFRPFDLEPGEEAMLMIDATYSKSCRPWQPGDATVLEPRGYLFRDGSIPVRFHFLWKTSTALINPFAQLEISFPKGCR